jgi:hypothetical protein
MEESENISVWNINNMVLRIIPREHNLIAFEEIEISTLAMADCHRTAPGHFSVLPSWIFDDERFICIKEIIIHPWWEQNPIFSPFLLFLLHRPQAPTPVKARPLPFLSRDCLRGAFALCDALVDDVFVENERENANVRNTRSAASVSPLRGDIERFRCENASSDEIGHAKTTKGRIDDL